MKSTKSLKKAGPPVAEFIVKMRLGRSIKSRPRRILPFIFLCDVVELSRDWSWVSSSLSFY